MKSKQKLKVIFGNREQIWVYWDTLDKKGQKKFFATGCLSIPAKRVSRYYTMPVPVSASEGMERYADFAPLGLPKIQHFCFLFAILSHK